METNDQKSTWKKILEFVVKLIELIIAAFLGGGAVTLFK